MHIFIFVLALIILTSNMYKIKLYIFIYPLVYVIIYKRRISMINSRIETFLTVCHHMNYTRAAEELHITQPAVSQQIHYLEKYYQAKLFSQKGRNIELTTQGKILLHVAETMQNDEARLLEKIRDSKKENASVIFGATMTIAEFALAEKLNSFLKAHPEFEMHMIMGNTAELISRLRSGEIHFAIVEGYFNKSDFECMLFKKEAYIPVCAKKHKFKKEPLTLSDLLEEEVLIREKGSGTRDILEKNLSVHNLSVQSFKRTIEIGSMQTLVQLLRMDNGISFMYKAAVEQDISKGIIKEINLTDFNLSHDFTFIWNKGSLFSKEYRQLCLELM